MATAGGAESAANGVWPGRSCVLRINIETEIVEGSFSLKGWDVPHHTAVHYWPVAGFPSSAGNITITRQVGYRDTIFNHLPNATIGDEVVLSIGEVERRYRVTELLLLTVLPSDSWVMAPTPDETLTLVTRVPIGVYSPNGAEKASEAFQSLFTAPQMVRCRLHSRGSACSLHHQPACCSFFSRKHSRCCSTFSG